MNRTHLPTLSAGIFAAACFAPMATVFGVLSVTTVQTDYGFTVPLLALVFGGGGFLLRHNDRPNGALVADVLGALICGFGSVAVFVDLAGGDSQYVSIGWGLAVMCLGAVAWLITAIYVTAIRKVAT